MQHEFPIIPPSGNAAWPFLLGAVIMLGAAALFVFLALYSGHEKFLITPAGLQITGSIYGRSIPAAKLLVGQARAVDSTVDPEFRLGMRRNGTGLPGYKSGWFNLPNRGNGDKALAFLTDRTKIAAVPTNDGYVVLMSVDNPTEFIGTLRATITR